MKAMRKIGGAGGVFGLGFLLVLTLSSCPNSMQMGLLKDVSAKVEEAGGSGTSQVSTPQFNPAGPVTFTSQQNVTITDSTVGSTIYYSYTTDTDDTDPPVPDPAVPSTYDGSGAASGVTIAVSGDGTKWKMNAIAIKSGMSDSVVATSGTYTVSYGAANPPSFDKGSGTYTVTTPASLTVTITNAAGNGSSVSYTTDGTPPSATHGTVSNAGSFPVTISTTGTTLKAIGFGGPYSISTSTTSATYTLQAAPPQFSPNGGSFSSSPSISISATMGATIRYTTDGSTPTTSHGTVYSGTFTPVPGQFTMKAIAYKSGLVTSTVSTSATYYVYPNYSIGATGPAGGIIFYANPSYVADGWRYLEAARSDRGTGTVWGGYGTTTGATGTAIGTGKSNTQTIVAAFGASEPFEGRTDYAAKLCDDYSNSGHSDWFLPSKDELSEMYLQKGVIGGFASDLYWSSSECSYTDAWFQNFVDGVQSYFFKNLNRRVRAVRAF